MEKEDKIKTMGDLWKRVWGAFRYSPQAMALVWTTSRGLTYLLAFGTVIGGLMPAAMAYIGKWIVDAVVRALQTGKEAEAWTALGYVGIELGLLALMTVNQRLLAVAQNLLRAQIGQRVNVMILEKVQTLSLKHFEDSDFYDKMTRARREASSRPLSLIMRTFGLLQQAIAVLSVGWLLFRFSGWAVLILFLAALPAFFAETYFSGETFRLFRWRVPETRLQAYLEVLLAREDYIKEGKIFQTGSLWLERYKEIFEKLYAEDRKLTIRKSVWGTVLGLVSSSAFYGTYAWIAWAAARRQISLGEMTMYLMLFRQGQAAFSSILSGIGGMYEDNLYLSNLYEFLDEPAPSDTGGAQEGPKPGDGVRFEGVRFAYPHGEVALDKIDLHLRPGQKLALVGENGSGKTTLIKLLTRLYTPTEGRILLDGLDLKDWQEDALRRRIGVIFQDFVKYQFPVGENIGVGDIRHFREEERWKEAAQKGMAASWVEELPQGYMTQLGGWFQKGRDLSIGQWQKIALSRAFMRRDADILVLDEPTSAIDAEAEAQIFGHFREKTDQQMAILISHRFSTVRMADQIVVLDRGRVVESGSHEDLMAQNGRYARLFSLQAEGYR